MGKRTQEKRLKNRNNELNEDSFGKATVNKKTAAESDIDAFLNQSYNKSLSDMGKNARQSA